MIDISPWDKYSFPFNKFIHAALSEKKAFIEEDEFDQSIRRYLNFGHTYGHAAEAISFNQIPHGYAVALGMDMANYMSMELGLIEQATFEKFHSLFLENYNFTYSLKPQDSESMIDAMKTDKKFRDGVMNLILMEDNQIGMKPIEDLELIYNSINKYLKYSNITN